MAELLRKEHGSHQKSVKLLMRRTHASERTVKHWLSGQHGPETVFFLRLLVSSPVIRAFVLGIIDKPAAHNASSAFDRSSLAATRDAYAVGESAALRALTGKPHYDPRSDPEHVSKDGPELLDLNERQHWFIERVAEGGRCSASEIVTVWRVCLKTARRDIAGLKTAGLIRYVGSRRKGRYLSGL